MIESNPLGRIVRPILKIVFILGALCMIILPMLGTNGASLQTYGGIIVGAVCTVFGLIVASQVSVAVRALVKIKAPSPILTAIAIVAIIIGYLLGYALGRVLLSVSLVVCIIVLILAVLAAVYCTAVTGILLEMAAISPLLLSDEDRETLRRNVKNNNIPLEYTKGRGAQVLDRILFEQGLGSRNQIRLSDD